MKEVIETIEISSWKNSNSKDIQQQAVQALEAGKVVYLPSLAFELAKNEFQFLSPEKVDPKSKNISYDIRKDTLGGTLVQGDEAVLLKAMIKRYATTSRELVESLFPLYIPHLIQARTSFRPVEASGRNLSYRKDDTLLHVDAFPSSPTKGQRILRVFANVNPVGKPRIWNLGEPFADVVKKFAPHVRKPLPGTSFLLNALGLTKGYRTLYDHYMLQMHDQMKGDAEYQKTVKKHEMRFPPGSTWIVYSDQASHAALGGQFMFEQTFHLPVNGMYQPDKSPLKILENFLHKPLV